MGLAIINQQANYTLERKAQNVIPVDESKRVYLTEVTNFNYEYAGNGIYRLKSLNIGSATQPYVYALAFTANQSGAEIDPISGVVTIGNDFTGGNLKVVINPIYDQYYPLVNGNTVYQANTTIQNPQTPESSSVIPYNNLTITGFSYSTNTINANGGTSVAPNLSYSYTKVVDGQSTTVSNTGGTKEYTMHSISASGATVDTSGVVSITANDTQTPKVFVIQAKVTVDGTYQTEVAKITQAAAETPTVVTYTYEFSNVSLSYPGTPIAATGNTTGLYPELSYTLTKRGSDNSTESISASSIVYSVQGTKPSGVTLTASNGKVTFAANATDDPVSVTIKATLTDPDGTEEYATATLTQNSRTLTGISFKSYNGANAINITTGTTINKSEISVNLIYNVGENGTGACTSIVVGGVTGTQESSHQFLEAGNYPMRIYHNDLYVDVQVAVAAFTKAYIVDFPEDPYSTEASDINISNDKATVTVPLKVNVMKLNSQGVPEEAEMTFEDYATTLDQAKESYNSPIITFSTNKAYNNLPSKTSSTNGELIYNFNESNYSYDATKVDSISIEHTTDSGKNVSYSVPIILQLNDVSETAAYFGTDNFTSEEINDTFIAANSWITKIASSSSSFHMSSNSNPSEGKIYLSDHGVVYKLTKEGDYYFKCSSPSTSNCAFAIISIPSSQSLKTHNNYQNYYTLDGTNVKYFYPDSRTRITYIHHTPTSGYDTYLLESASDSTAVGSWYVLTPKNNN